MFTKVETHCQLVPNAKIVVILSCPGKHEECAGKPAAGPTGVNLDELLSQLRQMTGNRDFSRERITITNSVKTVYYGKNNSGGATEPSKSEIIAPENLDRLLQEIGNPEVIICLGKKAQLAVDTLRKSGSGHLVGVRVLHAIHIGNQGLNSRHKKIKGNSSTENRMNKIKQVAKSLCDQYRRTLSKAA